MLTDELCGLRCGDGGGDEEDDAAGDGEFFGDIAAFHKQGKLESSVRIEDLLISNQECARKRETVSDRNR